jgi:hypothetical protein
VKNKPLSSPYNAVVLLHGRKHATEKGAGLPLLRDERQDYARRVEAVTVNGVWLSSESDFQNQLNFPIILRR